LFSAHGTVVSAKVIVDRDTQRSKGFGFVEMGSDDEAAAAMKALHETELEGRKIVVNEARPQEDRPPRSEGKGSYGSGGFGPR
jgi:RNA recognition motif-containing protein